VPELDKRFDDPARSFSPVPIWWWSGEKLDAQRLRWQLERFAEGGVYNLLILNLAPSGPLYGSDSDDPLFFSEEWWTMFRGVCEDARVLGMHLWFYDQFGFSGANMQARLVTQHPAFAGQALERIACDVEGTGMLECPEAGTPLAACVISIDEQGQPIGELSPLPVHGKSVTWQGSGTHRLMLFYSIESGFDYFNVSACQALLTMVHGAYEAHVGDFFGNVIVGTFQDELAAMPMWSRDFAQAFRARCGYDLLPHLPALWEDYGEQAQRVRHDYHATRSALAEMALFMPLFQWHQERGLICGFDQQGPARAGYPIQSVQLYADYPRTHRWYTAPGSDHHGEAKIHSSLAHLYDRPRVWIEAFHSSGWGGTLEETFDWLLPWLRAGATLYDPHAVYYSTRGGWWEWAPPSTDWRQPYWKHYHVFAQTISRLCSVLTLGHHVCDIGVLFPTTTVQAGLRLDGFNQDAQAAHDLYLRLVGKMHWYKTEPGVLDRACRDFDVLDDASIQRGEAQDGQLHVGEERYRVIILPGCTVLEDETAARLVEFVEGGGTLVAVGSIPHLSVGTTGGSAGLQQLTVLFERGRASIVSTPEEVVPLLAAVPAQIGVAVPTVVRRIGQATVVFVPAISPRATRMRSEQEAGVEAAWFNVDYTFDPSTYHRVLTVRVRGIQEAPELWEPYSGSKYLLEAQAIKLMADANEAFLVLTNLTDRLATQTDRTVEQTEYQQFSTPPALAFRRPVLLTPPELATAHGLPPLASLAPPEYAHLPRHDDSTTPVKPVVERIFWLTPTVLPLGRRILARRAHHLRDHQRGVGLREVLDELAAPIFGALKQLRQETAHCRAVAIDRARRERGVDEVAQPPVIFAVDVDDVLDDLLVQRTVIDLEQLSDRQTGEHGVLGAQEELPGLAIEHDEPEWAGGQPPVVALERLHRLPVAPAPQGGIGVVEAGELELCGEGHRLGEPSPRARTRRPDPARRRCTSSQGRSARHGARARAEAWPESARRSPPPGGPGRYPTRSRSGAPGRRAAAIRAGRPVLGPRTPRSARSAACRRASVRRA